MRHGETGYIIISHSAKRAGICMADGRSERGAWSEQTGTITTNDGRLYNRVGEQICDLKEQVAGQGAASG
jgi:hypothetical protein